MKKKQSHVWENAHVHTQPRYTQTDRHIVCIAFVHVWDTEKERETKKYRKADKDRVTDKGKDKQRQV